jgi:hypothetical protein
VKTLARALLVASILALASSGETARADFGYSPTAGGVGLPSPSFTPAGIPGLIVWLQANLGASASTWTDQSGQGNTYSQATTANKLALVAGAHQNGQLPAMRGNVDGKRFMGATHWSWPTTQSGTFILVFTPSSNASTYLISNPNGGESSLIENFSGSKVEWLNGGDRYTLTTSAAAGVHVAAVSCVYDSTLLGYFDGSLSFTETATHALDSPNYIGYEAGSNGTSGDILELLVWDVALSGAQLVQVTTYEQLKWGPT